MNFVLEILRMAMHGLWYTEVYYVRIIPACLFVNTKFSEHYPMVERARTTSQMVLTVRGARVVI